MVEKFFFMIRPESVEDLKKKTTFCIICTYMIPKVCFMDFDLLYENDRGEYVFACLLALFTLAHIACLLHI